MLTNGVVRSYVVADDLSTAQYGAIEVDLILHDGQERWCYFMTPAALQNCGDWVPGTHVTMHYDSPHMIVVSEISADVIDRVLNYLATHGLIERCTRPAWNSPSV